ncbi:MAG: hypothetical protein JZU47_22635 [Prolixibacteraceae bacterium]|nr:hypothetical protein [Prolixibacteraceae bacterium]
MIDKESFQWISPNGTETEPKSVELKYFYSPSFKFWVKETDTDVKPKPLMAILCYEITSQTGQVAHMTFAECLGESNMIDVYWIQGTNSECTARHMDSGELTRDSE